MFYSLFIFYFLIIGITLKKSSFFKNAEIPYYVLIGLFVLKVVAGLVYSHYFSFPNQIENADTWNYFIESKAETDWLLSNPKAFAADLFANHYSQTGNLFSCTNSFWNDLKTTFFVKLLALLNLLSGKNYYINLLFFNAFFMFGGVAFYRLFKDNFIINKWLLLVIVFFTPSFLFWCSGIHKDGVIFSATAISLFIFNKALKDKFNIIRIFILMLCFALIFLLRNYYLIAIIPAFVSWFIVEKTKLKVNISFAVTTISCLLILFFSSTLPITKSICESIVQKHDEFLTLDGNTKFQTPVLEAKVKSIISYFPFAMQSSLIRPFPNNIKSKGEFLAMMENYTFLIVLIMAVVKVFNKKNKILNSPIILSCILISFFLLLFIGYTVCFNAAIIRYRSVSFPLLIVPCIILIFGKLKHQLSN
ncbi:MAG: hypothetical protein ACOVO1_12670 [Chitinophagaceae bacterium]